jgi:hypothetical protein
MKIKKNALDLLKIGIFLLGISAIIFAVIAVHWYMKIQTTWWKPPRQASFYAYCEDGVIIVSARQDLTDVKVTDKEGNVVCEFDGIRANSEEICNANATGVFLVIHEDTKKAVTCREFKTVQPVVVGD